MNDFRSSISIPITGTVMVWQPPTLSSPLSYHHGNWLWHHKYYVVWLLCCKSVCNDSPSVIGNSHVAGRNYDKKGNSKLIFPEVMFNLKASFGVKAHISFFCSDLTNSPFLFLTFYIWFKWLCFCGCRSNKVAPGRTQLFWKSNKKRGGGSQQ